MRLGDFLLALAFDRGGDRNAVIMVLHQGKNHTVLDSAVQAAEFTYDTPVVNLLQSLSVDKVKYCWLYATYRPSEMDLGMACMRQVAGIVYPGGPNAAVQRTCSDDTGPGAESPLAGDNSWDLFITSKRRNDLEFPWGTKQKWQDLSWLDPWMEKLSKVGLSDSCLAVCKSYGALDKSFVRRPTADITKLTTSFAKGLGTVDFAPLAELPPDARDQLYMMAALALVGCSWSSELNKGGSERDTKLQGGHNIGAVMTDAGNRLIGWGLNLSVLNGTFHGETAMVLAYLRMNNVDRLPDGCRIYATLKPCHMCAGFIATVAKNVTVIYAQDDPKITHSALDDARGTGITQLSSSVTVKATMKVGDFSVGGRYMTVTEALAEMIDNSGLNAVPFLYSPNARTFYREVRRKPWLLDEAVKKFEALPPPTSQLSVRQLQVGELPERGLQTIPLVTTGLLKQTTLSPSAAALDLATGPALIPLPKNPALPVSGLNRGDVRNMGQTTVEFTDPSPTLKGLDLAIGNLDVMRQMKRRIDNRRLKTMLRSLGVIEQFLANLKNLGVISFN